MILTTMTLNKLSPSKHKKGRWLLHLENGDLLRVTEREVADFSLYSGMELGEETLKRLKAAAERSKMMERDTPEEEAAEIADWLTGLGLLNDGEYARQLARHYSEKGYGPRKIQDELYRRGVPREYWAEAMEERDDPAEAIDAFLAKRLGDDRNPDRKMLKKVSDALARRGFRWQDINDGLRRRQVDIFDD